MKSPTLFISLFILFFNVFCMAQVPHEQQNLQKYWVYRERLKDYMINGTDQGNSIPTGSRDAGTERMNWNDSPWFIGYWIGTLAMEYDLLGKYGNDVSQTQQDLFNAIEAVNRLDFEAESSLAWNCGASLNGFSIDDDVPDDFHLRFYNGETGADLLNGSWVPPPDGFRIKCINSSFAQYVTVREVSDDHVAALFIGFSLVKKFIPTTLNSSTPFLDGETNFVKEVQNIANRFIIWMKSESPHEWQLRNLCEDRCVHGKCNPTKPGFCGPHPHETNPSATDSDPCPGFFSNICSEGGAIAKVGAIGFIAANEFIQGQGSIEFATLVGSEIYRDAWNIDMHLIAKHSPWKITLAAIGNIWRFQKINYFPEIIVSSTTKQVAKNLVDDGVEKNWEHLILMHRLFYGTQQKDNGDEIKIPNSSYECLLDNAPCRGYDGNVLSGNNIEWGGLDRLAGERKHNPSAYSRVDYLFYFNLYNEINTVYLGNDYIQIPIEDLALENIDKNNYTEYDKKNFMAFNSITAHNSYTIANDPLEGQGRVTFVAGSVIDLLPGFDVGNGATLNAYIDPAIGGMDCINPTPVDATAGCDYLKANLKSIQDTTVIEEFDTLFVFQDSTVDTITLRTNYKNENTIQQPTQASYNISIIPNPSKGIFTLICKDDLQTIEVRDVLGNIVYRQNVNDMPVNMDVDIASHPPGIYFLKAYSNGKIYIEKVVVH